MSTFYLIRHAANDWLGKVIAGWTPGVNLNTEGRAQADRLAWKLLGRGITRIYSSPLERALETAAPVAKALGLKVEVRDALGEVRYGEWTGKPFTELEKDPRWARFNQLRSSARPPGGETMLEIQARMTTELESLRLRHPEETVAVVSHGDPIRAVLMHFLGMPIDMVHRIEISPASVTVVTLEDWGPRVLTMNEGSE